jgi:hypothetical protein
VRHTEPRAAYAARTTQIHAKLARLQQLADGHFGHDPNAVHWGHVGDLGRVEQALDDLLTPAEGAASARRGSRFSGSAYARRNEVTLLALTSG